MSRSVTWRVLVFLVPVVCQGVAACAGRVEVRPGDSVETLDGSLCANGTLVLARGVHTWGSVVLHNVSSIEGGGNIVTAIRIEFRRPMVAVSEIEMKSWQLKGHSLVMRNTRIASTTILLDVSQLSMTNVTLVEVVMVADSSFPTEWMCELCHLTSSNVTVGTEPSKITLRRSELTNTTLNVKRTKCNQGEIVTIEDCAMSRANVTVEDSIVIGCAGEGLGVLFTRTTATDGSISVASLYGLPVLMAIVNSSVQSVSVNVLTIGSPLQFTVIRSVIQMSILTIHATNQTVNVSLSGAVFEMSALVLTTCTQSHLNVLSSGSQYKSDSRSSPALVIKVIGAYCPGAKRVVLHSNNDTYIGIPILYAEGCDHVSLTLTKVTARHFWMDSRSIPWPIVFVSSVTLRAVITNSAFENNAAGGAIVYQPPAEPGPSAVMIDNCIFSNLTVVLGAVNLKGTSLRIVDCEFSNISALSINVSGVQISTEVLRLGLSAVQMIKTTNAAISLVTTNATGDVFLQDISIIGVSLGVEIECTGYLRVNASRLTVVNVQSAWRNSLCQSEFEIRDSRFINNNGSSLFVAQGLPLVRIIGSNITSNTMIEMLNMDNGTVIAIHCRFINNTSPGPVIRAYNVTLTNCLAQRNNNINEQDPGGGVANAYQITDEYGVYNDNQARNGGAFDGESVWLRYTLVNGSKARSSGGFLQANNVFASNAVFLRCSSGKQGGAIFSINATISNSTFESCRADKGGSVATEAATVMGATFNRSTASTSGGAITTINITLSDSNFHDCWSGENGGALESNEVAIVNSSQFYNCTAIYGLGGGINAYHTNVTSSYFEKCNATGGAALQATHATTTNITVIGCISYIIGGGIYIAHTCRVSDCRFVSNRAFSAGALWCWIAYVNDSVFSNNSATAVGGAASVTVNSYFTNCIFSDNRAGLAGGALRATDGLEMRNVLIESNSAANNGGVSALYLLGVNVTFRNNKAIQGGAMSAQYFKLNDSHFIGNSASIGGAVFIDAKQKESILHTTDPSLRSIVANNTVPGGSAFACHTDGNCVLSCTRTDFVSNTGGGMFSNLNSLSVVDSNFTDNHFTDLMLQCKLGNSCNITILNSTFDQNKCSVLRGNNVTLTIRESKWYGTGTESVLFVLSNSRVDLSWVAFYSNQPLLELNFTYLNASFLMMENNTRNIILYNSTAHADHCVCRSNTALSHNGTCLAIFDSVVNVYNLSATGNKANFGSDVYAIGQGQFVVHSSRFVRSNATQGGSFWVNTNLRIENCSFEYTIAVGGPRIRVNDSYVRRAPSPGAAVAFFGKGYTLRMAWCAVRHCQGGYGALAVVGESEVVLEEINFTANEAEYGGALALSDGANVQIKGGAALNNSAPFGNVVISSPTVALVSMPEWTIYLRAKGVSVDVITFEGGSPYHLGMQEGAFNVAVGIGFIVSGNLVNSEDESVVLSEDLEARAKLSAVEDLNEANAHFEPDLNQTESVIHSNGTIIFPNISVTGGINKIITLSLVTDLLPAPVPFKIKLAGCPPLYGLEPHTRQGKTQGKTCKMCEKGEYSYGGVHHLKCVPCDETMKCDGNSLPMSNSGYWIHWKDGVASSVKCPIARLCKEGNKCAFGYNVTSLVCGECDSERFLWGGHCVLCPENYGMLFAACLLVLVVINMYVIFVQRTALPSRNASLNILLQYSQVALLVVPETSSESWNLPVQFLSNDPAFETLLPCFIKVKPTLLFHGPAFFSLMSTTILVLHRFIWAGWRKRRGLKAQKTTTYNSLISLLFLSVYSTTSSMLDFISCVPVSEQDSLYVVVRSPSIKCTGEDYYFHCVMLASYSALAWAVLGIALGKIIIQYKISPAKATSLWTFMFHHFESSYPQRAAYLTKWDFHRALLRSQFCRWWQCVMLARRVILLVISVLVKRQKINANIAFPLTLVAFLYLHVLVNPYKSYLDDLTDGLGILLLLIASLVSSSLSACYATVVTGSFILAGYALYEVVRLISRVTVSRAVSRLEANLEVPMPALRTQATTDLEGSISTTSHTSDSTSECSYSEYTDSSGRRDSVTFE